MTDKSKNTVIWEQVEKTPPRYATEFNKGKFSGTSVNPICNAERATEIFGPAGKGWGTRSLQTMVQKLDEETVMISEEVELWYIWDGEECKVSHWASEFVMSRVNKKRDDGGYIQHDDEAWKKCRTNATSKCFSLLGFSADLWKGYYESDAYIQDREKEQSQEDYAKTLKENYKGAIKILDTFCLCETDEDREAICKWVVLDEKLTLGSMQVTPGLAYDVQVGLAEAKDQGIKSHEMLSRAKEWVNSREKN